MSATETTSRAEQVIARLRAHEAALRAAGILRLWLFGSVARGEDGPESDVDLLVQLDPAAQYDLIRLVGLQQDLSDLLGCPVDVATDPIRKPRVRANIERDRQLVF